MPNRRQGGLYNFLAAAFLVLTVLSLGWTVAVALNPRGPLNPLPPRAVAVALSATATPAIKADTPTVAATEATDEATQTAAPTEGTATATQTALTPTGTLSPASILTLTASSTPTLTPPPSPTRSTFTYTAIITYQVHPVQVCDWMGVAGTVTDLQGRPSLGAFVHVWGLGNVDQIVAAGANPTYGPSGWELRLARAQIVGDWHVQLVASPESKQPLSEVYTISMPGDCKKNLALIGFRQNH